MYKESKTRFREPKVLLTGRLQSTLDVLAEELIRYGRDVVATNDRARINQLLSSGEIDFAVIGGGLDDAQRDELKTLIKSVRPSLPVLLVPRTPTANPSSVIPFVNESAVLFKVNTAASEAE